MREPVQPSGRAAVRAALLSFVLLAGVPATAQGFPARDVGGWTVAASKDGQGCFITRTYPGAGGTTLLLGLDADGSNHLTVLNDHWSIQPKAQLKLDFRLSNGGYPDHPAVGIGSDGKNGFVTDFEAKFVSYFASSKAIHIYRGKVPVEQLGLEGSGAAVAELRRCVGMIGAGGAAGDREKGRSSLIPRDPFAPDADPAPKD